MVQNTCCRLFSIHHFVCTYVHNSKTKGCKDILSNKQLLYYQRYLFPWLELYARCDRRVMAPNSFFLVSHLCIITGINWKLLVIYICSAYRTTALHTETFLVWFRIAREIQLESYTRPDTHQSFSDTKLCVYTASLYIHCYFLCNYAWQQNSHTVISDFSVYAIFT